MLNLFIDLYVKSYLMDLNTLAQIFLLKMNFRFNFNVVQH